MTAERDHREAELDRIIQAEPDDSEVAQAEKDRLAYDYPVPADERV